MKLPELSENAEDMLFFIIRYVLRHSRATSASDRVVASYYDVSDVTTLESVAAEPGRALADLLERGLIERSEAAGRISYHLPTWMQICLRLAADQAQADLYDELAESYKRKAALISEKVNTLPQPYLETPIEE